VDVRTALGGWRELFVGAGAPGGLPRWPRWMRPVWQPLLAIATLLLAFIARASVHPGGWATQLVAVAGVAPLPLLAWRPLVAWRVAWVAAAVSVIFPAPREESWPWAPVGILVFLLVLYAVGATQPPRVTIWIWAAMVVLVVAEAHGGGQPGISILVTVLLLVGDQVRRRRRAQRELAHEEERSAVLAERTRIARELHDVVAHHMSLIAVRAETAPFRLGGIPDSAREEFGQISAAARESLVEMRRLLGVLRSEDQELLTAPQPGIANLAELVERACQAGAAVELTLPDGTVGASPAVELTAYRIVQEALSNAARHAPGVPASVVLARTDKELTVLVRNGPTPRPPVDNGAGHGLVGMRERAAALGGTLSAERTADGGFEVRAALPLAEGPG
jgi:signal transduction histidine kinase